MKVLFWVFIASWSLLLGCSNGSKETEGLILTRDTATEVINKSLQGNKIGSVYLNVGGHCDEDALVVAAQKAGLEIEQDPNLKSLKCDPERFRILPGNAGVAVSAIDFPIANRAVGELTIRQVTETTAQVEFKWKWALLPDGEKLVSHLSPRQLESLDRYLQKPKDQDFSWAALGVLHSDEKTLRRFANGWHIALDNEKAFKLLTPHVDSVKLFDLQIGRVGAHCRVNSGAQKVGEVIEDVSPEKNIGAMILAKAGYISVVPDGKGYWQTSLTAKGRASSDVKLFPEPFKVLGACNFQKANVTLARQQMVEITNIDEDRETAEVEYSWRWILTDLGSELGEHGAIYLPLSDTERTTLQRYLARDQPAFLIPIRSEPIVKRARLYLNESDESWNWR